MRWRVSHRCPTVTPTRPPGSRMKHRALSHLGCRRLGAAVLKMKLPSSPPPVPSEEAMGIFHLRGTQRAGWGPGGPYLCSLRIALTHLDSGARDSATWKSGGLLAGSHGARPGGREDS